MTLTRRSVLRSAALAVATAAARRAPIEPLLQQVSGVTWDKAPCRFCGSGCHVQVGVQDGKVVAVAGDDQAEVNKGLLCVKGYHVGEVLAGEGRLTTPLLRKEGVLSPVSWDEALDVLADRVAADPAGLGIYGSGQWTIPEGYVANKLLKGGLANNHIDPNARLCMASAVTGFLATYGVDEPASCYDDLEECDVAILWGANMAENHPVLFSRLLDRRLRGKRPEIIDLGTRRTRTSDQADRFVLFRPQTDLAIANGVAHLLLARGTWDRAFVEGHCAFRQDVEPLDLKGQPMSFEAYREALAPYTPEHVSSLSGVPVEELEHLADLFGDRELRIASFWCMGVNQHTRGTAMNTLLHGVHLLSGHFGRPGDGPSSLTGQPSACGTVREVGTLSHTLPGGRLVANAEHRAQLEDHWKLPRGRIAPQPGHHTLALFESFVTPRAEGGDVSTLWVQVTNPAQSLPDADRLFFERRDPEAFLVVSDVYETATTRHADLVLPSPLWVEKNGVYGNSERRTQQWFRMVDPPGEARDEVWQMIALARRLFERGLPGMQDRDGGFLFDLPADDGADAEAGGVFPAWRWDRFRDENVDRKLFEEYRPLSRLKHKDLAPYDEYVRARGLRWPVVERGGRWEETRWRFVEGSDPYVEPGKGVQFYHSTTGDDRAQIWFRPFVEAAEPPDGEYPFWLSTGRVLEHWHTATMTGVVPELRDAMPTAYAELNPRDARALGVRSGDTVEVATRRGALRLPVWVGGRGEPPPGTVFVPFFDEGHLVNRLTIAAHDPISKQPDYKKCAASVRVVES